MGLTVMRGAARIVGGHHQADVAWRDCALGRHLDDGIVRIGASVDQVDDAVERVS